MNEEKKPQENEAVSQAGEAKTATSTGDGLSKIQTAEALAARIEAATLELKKENDRLESLKVNEVLGGTTEAGQSKEEPKEVSPVEYVEAIMNGDIDGKQADE